MVSAGGTTTITEMTVRCVWCGKEFKTFDRRRKLCSPECQRKQRNKTSNQSKKPKAVKVYNKVCKLCGKPFTTAQYREKLCSAECRAEAEMQCRLRAKSRTREYNQERSAKDSFTNFKKHHRCFEPEPGDKYNSYQDRQIAKTLAMCGKVEV